MRKLKNKAKVAAAPSNIDVRDEQLNKDMDDFTPGASLTSHCIDLCDWLLSVDLPNQPRR